jgi:predicted transcriptional regulator
MKKRSKKELLIKILKNHPEGLTIQKLASLAKMSRITATKYVERLIGEGKIVERKIGIYRLLFLKERFLETMSEKEIIEKIKKKLK